MGNIQDIIAKQSSRRGQEKKADFRIHMIHYTKIHPSKNQFYSQDDIEKLADLILLAGEIKQNLLVRRTDLNEYELISGHKRRLAGIYLSEHGHPEFSFLPCKIENENDLLSEYLLITTNSTQRERSDYEKAKEVERLKEIIPQLTADETLKGRALRQFISEETGMSKTKIAQLENINNNLCEEGMEHFQKGELKVSAANELAGLTKEQQREVLKEKGPEIKTEEIRKIKTVSETDTKPMQNMPEHIIPPPQGEVERIMEYVCANRCKFMEKSPLNLKEICKQCSTEINRIREACYEEN